MSFGFRNAWNTRPARERVDAAQRDALNEAGADGETIMKSPAPTGWPRLTSFLANSSGFDEARRERDGWRGGLTVDAEYWPHVNRRTQTLNRAGEAVARTLGERVKRRLG